jgi:putative transposase
MLRPMTKSLAKQRARREPDPLDTPEMNAFVDSLLTKVTTAEDLTGRGGIFQQLQAKLVNRALEAEMSAHLGHESGDPPAEDQPNRRNGRTSKKVRSSTGSVKIQIPRDREGTFEPIIVPKHSRVLGQFGDAIIALYSRGMSQRDIARFMDETYGVQVDRDVISRATEAVWEEVQTWQKRTLEGTYLVVWVDALVVKSAEDGTVKNRAAYLAIGLTSEGEKEVLGLWMQENEGAKFWLQVLSELRGRGVQDILFLCADGLKGLPEAFEASFPQAIFQTCIVHVIRASNRYVPWKNRREVCEDLRAIYGASSPAEAEAALDSLDKKWSEKFPAMVKTWRSRWDDIIPFLSFPAELRKTIYTTNPIEGLNRVIRKSLKTRGHMPSDRAAQKLIYLAIRNAKKTTWGRRPRDWVQRWHQFEIHFGDRVPPLT